ncbi:hypothetical protein GOQ29_00700 [Clostridium sp. D2Q-14]|uniref:CdaR family protein n=1 Tax=Anaeromonas gelatinilytica TaxID=2683194 RepID=UPI00193BC048|nr:CdaR family protein [Anaeromonas gelatinilytica]MBS4534130.1 hypothetical protein [Anaeromonas gelatinilytica]
MKKIDLTDRNFTMKIVAVFFAFIMWAYVMSEVNPEIVKTISNVDVEILNESSLERDNLMLMELGEKSITVEVKGRRNNILGIGRDDITARIDLRGYREGVNKVPIEITGTSNGEIVNYYPKTIEVNIDKLIEKQMPISVNLSGEPKEGYADGEINISPDEVLVRGPRSIVNKVNKVMATVNIDEIEKDISTSVPMKLLNSDNEEITRLEKEPNTVNVEVSILKLKDVEIEPVIEGAPSDNYQLEDIEVSPKKITIKGSEDVVKDIDVVKTKPINISQENNSVENEVELELPEGVYLASDVKPKVTVNISKEERKTFEFDKEEIEGRNINEDYEFKLNESENGKDKIKITIIGQKNQIKDIEKEDLKVYMDLKDLSVGNHAVGIEVEFPDDIEIEEINPDTLDIIIEENTIEENEEEPEEETDST